MQKQEALQAKLLQLESGLRQLANLDRKMPLGLGPPPPAAAAMVQQGAVAPSPGVVGGDPRQWQRIPPQDMGQLVRLVQYLNAMSSLNKPVLPGGVEIDQVRKVPEKTSLKTHIAELLDDENTVLHYTFQSQKFVDVEDLKALWKTDRFASITWEEMVRTAGCGNLRLASRRFRRTASPR